MDTLKDNGPNVHTINIHKATERNNTFRTAIWTGPHMQVTVMSIEPGDDVGLEIHEKEDQFFRVEKGRARVEAGPTRDNLTFRRDVSEGDAIFIPSGTWHNIINTGRDALKVYSIYAPPHHPHGTVHVTKADDHGHDHGPGSVEG